MTEKQEQLHIYLAIVKCIIASHKATGDKLHILTTKDFDKYRGDEVMAAEREYSEAMDHCLALLEKAAS